ncbi:tripartite tricarboxylate transporter permease [Yangia mangrovi]|uniref:Tripartite tricarboxylate transporter permease n=1 Tax=Alloyangia mangrovi TaxID=1779329 RepID=A0A2A3JVY5_9RHOB|nr:tripartite tricarboxylate transporter permease [Alloyangia mangrovi]MCT4373036.1 tripartite tricarboxylate transporter permease [Alloyangia mangrovi]
MTFVDNIALGLSVILNLSTLGYCVLGVTVGMFIGVLPGLGPLATVGMLLPLTFYVPQTDAIVMLAGIYYGSMYGGSTAAILLNLPGTAGAAVTCLDGNPLAKSGRAGVALFTATLSSFFGGIFGLVVVASFTPLLASVALSFGSPEYASLIVLGLLAAAMVGNASKGKSLAMALFGLLIAMVGTDPNSGVDRMTFGLLSLADGVNLVVVTTGLFGIAEVLANVGRIGARDAKVAQIRMRDMLPTAREARGALFPALRGSSIGAILGILPGTGAALATFVAYAVEKRTSKTPERFGKGALEGIVAPESANNSAAQTAFVPTLSLGIPGDAIVAIMLGALIIHGIVPGPQLIRDHPDLFWGLIASFLIGNVVLLFLNLPLIGIWVRILRIPYSVLYPAILVFICVGVFSIRSSVFDVAVATVFGLGGYVMRRYGFPTAPLLLGLVLGPLLEQNFRRSLMLSRGDLMTFADRPISGSILALTLLIVIFLLGAELRRRRPQAGLRKEEQR